MTHAGAIVWRVLVDGAVQGVGYREFTRRAALTLGVTGWVHNRTDGAVEALIRGPHAAAEALVAEMRKGPRLATVNSVIVTELDETPHAAAGLSTGPWHSAEGARTPAPRLQPRRGGLSALGGFVRDRSGPPADVGVLAGGSLAGKDSSSSSSSLSSGFDCGLLAADFRGSFIPASPWVPMIPLGLNSKGSERCRSQVLPRSHSTAELSVQFCAQLKLFKRLTSFFRNSDRRRKTGCCRGGNDGRLHHSPWYNF